MEDLKQLNEVCIAIGELTKNCKHCLETFFADNEVQFLDVTRWPQLLVHLGVFPSTSEARRNGWDKEIAEGWTEIKIGKLKRTISVWRCTEKNPNYSFYLQPHKHYELND